MTNFNNLSNIHHKQRNKFKERVLSFRRSGGTHPSTDQSSTIPRNYLKKLITIPLSLLACASAYGQGEVSFDNSTLRGMPDCRVMETVAGVTTVVNSSGGVKVAMFYQPDLGGAAPDPIGITGGLGSWEATSITGISALPGGGIFLGGIQVLPDINVGSTGPGAAVWVEILAWNNNAASLSAALSGGSTLFGSSTVFAHLTDNYNGLPTPTYASPLTTADPGAFTGLTLTAIPDLAVSPEPSTLALGGLGAAVLFFFRRRK